MATKRKICSKSLQSHLDFVGLPLPNSAKFNRQAQNIFQTADKAGFLRQVYEEIEEYKDWQVGDKITKGRDVFEVIFRSGEVVILKNNDGLAEGPFTCDEIYNDGSRLVAEPAPESDDSVEVSMAEVAEKLGVPVEKLRIKKE